MNESDWSLERISTTVRDAVKVAGEHTKVVLHAQTGIDAPPENALQMAALALCVVLGLLCALVRVVSVVRANERARSRRLAVQIADHAPVDDGDDHEDEKHSDMRAAAPGDSDFEDDTPRKGARSQR